MISLLLDLPSRSRRRLPIDELKLQARASGGHGAKDQFPVGMRVIAVDDDPTCLKVL
jgi:two-component response regulator ARR-B family